MEENFERLSDEEIINLYKNGDSGAGEYLLSKYKTLVRKKARLYYLDGGDQEDLLQEGMLGLFKAMKEYDPSRQTSFFTFADLCVNHQMLTAVESANRKKHKPLNESVPIEGLDESKVIKSGNVNENPETLFVERETADQMLEEWKKLFSGMETEVFNLYLEGYDYLQIAEKLEKSGKSIDNCLQRIKNKIKKSRN
jgi:RNA polymerase sporulation-specific sigma factor